MKVLSTLLQIDLQNLFYTARTKGKKIDFEKIWNLFSSRETEVLSGAIVYMIRSSAFDSTAFEKILKEIGYELRIKNAAKSTKKGDNTYIGSDHDIPIVVDCLNKVNTFDKLILMSGDGDFAYLCEDLRRKGKQIEIWSFRESFNIDLSMCADRVCYMDDGFFLKRPKVKEFGIHGELE